MARNTLSSILLLGAALVPLLVAPSVAVGGSLENLERERAALVVTLLDPDLDPDARQGRVAPIVRRLVDLERMVLRDKSLVGKGDPDTLRAFEDYDRTFLVHASTEHESTPLAHWLGRVGLSTGTIRAARLGRR